MAYSRVWFAATELQQICYLAVFYQPYTRKPQAIQHNAYHANVYELLFVNNYLMDSLTRQIVLTEAFMTPFYKGHVPASL